MANPALPNPFQNAASSQFSNTSKSAQNDTSFFHGYRSNFNINQQKEMYEQRMSQQRQQNPRFNRNVQRTERIANDVGNANTSYSSNWCELCERSFKFPHQLEKHLGEHEKCWFDNCNFEGHSKLLQKHLEDQHQSGLFQRIGKIETDEDIEKWKAERKRRFPTKANIEARQLAQQERMKRGERIREPNNRFGSVNNRRRAQQQTSTEHQNDPLSDQAKTRNDKKPNEKKRRRTRNRNNRGENCKMINAEAIGAVKTDAAKVDEAAKSDTIEPVESKKIVAQNANALLALMGNYGSDSDDDNDDNDETETAEVKEIESDKPEEVDQSNEKVEESEASSNLRRSADFDDEPPTKQPKVDLDPPKLEHVDASDDDDDAPVEEPIHRPTDLETKDELSGPTQTRPEIKQSQVLADKIPKRRTVLDMTRKIRSQNTLLEKLLQADIRHERNVLLQCVRYVVQNDFFGIGQEAKQTNVQNEPST